MKEKLPHAIPLVSLHSLGPAGAAHERIFTGVTTSSRLKTHPDNRCRRAFFIGVAATPRGVHATKQTVKRYCCASSEGSVLTAPMTFECTPNGYL